MGQIQQSASKRGLAGVEMSETVSQQTPRKKGKTMDPLTFGLRCFEAELEATRALVQSHNT